jgi:hypothetical protein
VDGKISDTSCYCFTFFWGVVCAVASVSGGMYSVSSTHTRANAQAIKLIAQAAAVCSNIEREDYQFEKQREITTSIQL